ncbi:hypothetical protein O181_101443 [Austropuccinia psidii MF-1]|uniref:Uncharacterized protein n=1 Tax=Austropuccinia psidii MF-1 TaxID=1389203 RepID=A0A9Q3JEG3_9BASI|nr:hypothetical protein [Austropuccinia psidii MF-1]
MCICICQHCSAQTHSSPEEDRQGVSFTSFQYKQNIENLKSAIKPKSIPNIPTSVSGSECPQILLDPLFPNDYSKLTQSTFSTPPGLNSSAQKPYSSIQKPAPQNLGIIIFSILSLRYNIPHMDSFILTPSLSPLIKSSISISGGQPTLALHIPQYISTIFQHLLLELLIESFVCCI